MSHVKTPSLHLSLPTLKASTYLIWSPSFGTCNLTSMASLSRIVLKDCKLGTYDAVYRPSSSFPARKLQTYLGMYYFFLLVYYCLLHCTIAYLLGWHMGFHFFWFVVWKIWHFGEWKLPSFELFRLLLVVALSCSEYQLKFLYLLL